MIRVLLVLLFFAHLAGCDKKTADVTSPSEPSTKANSSNPDLSRSLSASPSKQIFLVEDQSQALAIWARTGVRNATLLHVDAHHDLLPAPTAGNIEVAENLLREGRFDEVEASGRYLAGRDKALYGIDNYLNLAYKLGLIKKIFWAYPYQGTPTREKLAAYRDYLIDSAAPKWKAEFRALDITPPFITGNLGGVPITIGSLSDFETDRSPLLLDIDLSYFPQLYRNPVATPYLSLLGGFVRFINERQLQPAVTVIAYSNNGGLIPVGLRYLGPWLKDLLAEPELLERDLPIPWKVKAEAVHREFFEQYESAAELFTGLVKEYPNNPDSHFSLAMNLIALGNEDQGLIALEKARQLDSAYILGYITAAEFYLQQKVPELAIKTLEKAVQVAPTEVVILDALGNLYHNQQQYRQAVDCYQKVLATDNASSTTYAYLADSLFFLNSYQEALANYQKAIDSRLSPDTYLDPVVWLQLAQTQVKLGRIDEAAATLKKFIKDQPDAPEELRTEARQQLSKLLGTPTALSN